MMSWQARELEERHEEGRRRAIERRCVVVHVQADASGYLENFRIWKRTKTSSAVYEETYRPLSNALI